MQLDLLLGERGRHDLHIAYAAPTPVWKPSYRVVLPDGPSQPGLLQAWAIVHNASGEPWRDVELVLATGAPLSFALDLQKPEFAPRPDLNGRLVQPVATGIVQAEQAKPVEPKIDPNLDSDHDRIPDALDKCPNEPETYNGFEDEDGCPDKGRIIVRSSKLEILDRIYFERGSSNLKPASAPILDATAATLRGNPGITLIEVQGHACMNEENADEIARRRAAAVIVYLVHHGVERSRLQARGYGSTKPLSNQTNEESCSRNRRVEFVIVQQRDSDDDRPHAPPVLTASALAQSAGPSATPADIAGATYYTVSDHVTLPRGASTMVSMLTLNGGTEDIFLFRPDGHVAGSDRHPLRAARLRIGAALEPGPVAVFSHGSFVGEGVLGRMHAGETALLPYAVDSSASVTVTQEERRQPRRLIGIHDGVASVEDEDQSTTRYDISTGAQAPSRIFLRHARRADYRAIKLPDESEESPDAYLLPQLLGDNRQASLSLLETRQARRTLSLQSDAQAVCQYLPTSAAPPAVQNNLRALCRLQKELQENRSSEESLRNRIELLRNRAEELRGNLQAIEKIATAGPLRAELLTKLRENEQRSGELQKQIIARSEAQATQEARQAQLIAELQLDESTN